MMARQFFYACAGLFLLALSFHFGATSVSAQAPGNPVVAVGSTGYVFTANGDVYRPVTGFPDPSTWAWAGNVFGTGGPTPAQHESWGQLKSRYAPNSAPVLQAPTNK